MSAAVCWCDFGWWIFPDGQRRLLSWNAETKELSFWALHRFEDNRVVAHFLDEDEVRDALAGWEAYNSTPDGLSWLAERLGTGP